jgi:hypothetical protein
MKPATDEDLDAALVRLAAAKRTRDTVYLAYSSDPTEALGDCVAKAEIAFETALLGVIEAHGSWKAGSK